MQVEYFYFMLSSTKDRPKHMVDYCLVDFDNTLLQKLFA